MATKFCPLQNKYHYAASLYHWFLYGSFISFPVAFVSSITDQFQKECHMFQVLKPTSSYKFCISNLLLQTNNSIIWRLKITIYYFSWFHGLADSTGFCVPTHADVCTLRTDRRLVLSYIVEAAFQEEKLPMEVLELMHTACVTIADILLAKASQSSCGRVPQVYDDWKMWHLGDG